MAEIKITGKKAIKTINKEFQEKFPFLMLILMSPEEWLKAQTSKGRRSGLPGNLRISEVRTVDPKRATELSIHGRNKIKTLEEKFLETYGLHIQIGFGDKEGNFYYTSDMADEMTLTQLNKSMEEKGMKRKPRIESY